MESKGKGLKKSAQSKPRGKEKPQYTFFREWTGLSRRITEVKTYAGFFKTRLQGVLEIKLTYLKIIYLRRLVYMSKYIQASPEFVHKQPHFDMSVFYPMFGEWAVHHDWKYYGIVITELNPPGRFVALQATLIQRLGVLEARCSKIAKDHHVSSAWLSRMSQRYDYFGMPLPKVSKTGA